MSIFDIFNTDTPYVPRGKRKAMEDPRLPSLLDDVPSPENMPAVTTTANPGTLRKNRRDGVESPVLTPQDALDRQTQIDNSRAILEDQQKRNALVQKHNDMIASGRNGTHMAGLLQENPDAPYADLQDAMSSDLAEEIEGHVRQVMSQNNNTPDDKEFSRWKQAWKTFNDRVDLTAMGAALMASNGNRKTFTQNMGMALAAGMQEKTSNTRWREEQDRKNLQTEISAANAHSLRMKALAEQTGIDFKQSNKTTEAMVLDSLNRQGIDPDEIEGIEEFQMMVGSMFATALESDPKNAQSAEWQDRMVQAMIAKYRQERGWVGSMTGPDFGYRN